MHPPEDSSDRRPIEFIQFALLFVGIILGLTGVILALIPLIAISGILIACGIAGFAFSATQ